MLIYQIGSLGDTLVTVPAYRAIRRHFGQDAQFSVLYNSPPDGRATVPQVLAACGLVDNYIGFSSGAKQSPVKTLLNLWPRLASLRADAVVNLGPWNRSASELKRDKWFFHSCGIRQTIGFHALDVPAAYARDDKGWCAPERHVAQLNLDRISKDGIDVQRNPDEVPFLLTPPEEETQAILAWLAEQGQTSSRPLVAICPGANQPAKFWPLERFIEIGWRIIATGYEPVILGGSIERAVGEELVSAWGTGVNAAGLFPVIGSAALLRLCQFLVGLDTGTTHLAAAVGTPCVALYADRDPPGQWDPLGQGHTVLRHPVPCGGCRLRECNVAGHPCMTGITVDEVWQAIQATIADNLNDTQRMAAADHQNDNVYATERRVTTPRALSASPE